ncbi:MAG: hypothetical protein AB7K09_24635 [Planctomycetota bacterium]
MAAPETIAALHVPRDPRAARASLGCALGCMGTLALFVALGLNNLLQMRQMPFITTLASFVFVVGAACIVRMIHREAGSWRDVAFNFALEAAGGLVVRAERHADGRVMLVHGMTYGGREKLERGVEIEDIRSVETMQGQRPGSYYVTIAFPGGRAVLGHLLTLDEARSLAARVVQLLSTAGLDLVPERDELDETIAWRRDD